MAAAAGSGKTTLIVDWTEPRKSRTCWLALDKGDDEPAHFFGYLLAAIQQCEPTVGVDLATSLQSAQRQTFDDITALLINQLAMLSEDLIVVLDDYHVIENEQIHEAMARLLTHQPEGITFVLMTRADPPLPLARMRANGQLTEIRADNLAFTDAESTDFFNESFRLGLTQEQVNALSERTEGWSAGLQLVALALQTNTDDKATFIRNFTGSHRHVLDYLMEEVLRTQDDAVRSFMMHTAPLHQFNASLCNAVMAEIEPAQQTGAAMLDYLEANHLFLVPLDDSRQWYRYHHLFAELLRAQLDEQAPGTARKIQRSAAEWHEAQQNHEQAIDYALTAGEFPYAADLIQAHMASAYWRTALHTWRRWHQLWHQILPHRTQRWPLSVGTC